MGPWVHVPAPVPLAGITEEVCFALLPRASPRDYVQQPTVTLLDNVPFAGLLPFPASLPTPLPVLPTIILHRNNSQVGLCLGVGFCISSGTGKSGFRNGLTRGLNDAQPPAPLSDLSPLIGSVLFFPVVLRLTSSQYPSQGRRGVNSLLT